MSKPPDEKLTNKLRSSYPLVNLASKRARELLAGAPKLIETDKTDPLEIALEEIAQGEITWREKKEVSEEGKKRKKSATKKK